MTCQKPLLFLALCVCAPLAIGQGQVNPGVQRMKKAPIKLVTVEPASVAVPNGSYLQFCAPVRTDGDLLIGQCKTPPGGVRESSIRVSHCAGVDIANHYGQLRCLTPVRAHWDGLVMPPGSYVDSCGAYVKDGMLRASCGTGEGESKLFGLTMSNEGLHSTELNLGACPDGADIANIGGHLTCVK